LIAVRVTVRVGPVTLLSGGKTEPPGSAGRGGGGEGGYTNTVLILGTAVRLTDLLSSLERDLTNSLFDMALASVELDSVAMVALSSVTSACVSLAHEIRTPSSVTPVNALTIAARSASLLVN